MNEQSDRVTAQRLRLRQILLDKARNYGDFISKLSVEDVFDRKLFYAFRSGTMSQAEWAQVVGVSQGTIGNWERGITYPARVHRKSILRAANQVLEREQQRIEVLSDRIGIKVRIDVLDTRNQLDSSILRAALTDLEFDPSSGSIIPVPFATDARSINVEELVRDRRNLLDALAAQTAMICDGLKRGANTDADRFIEYLVKYGEECEKREPNARLLHRFGATIAARTSDEDFLSAINGWDDQAIEGFNADHQELMRLYYREALARAQEVEAAVVDEDVEGVRPADGFYRAAEVISSAKTDTGKPAFSEDVVTLLRDIGREVRDLTEAEVFTADERRRAVLKRRRREAIKAGSIFIGRILFFTSLFVVMSPEALGAASNMATILGLMDQVAPGSIRDIYDRMRSVFPILPKLDNKTKKGK